MRPGRYQCDAGFWHAPGDECGHIVPLPAAPVLAGRSPAMTPKYAPSGFYSEEATAARKAENKIKYMPQWRREQLELAQKISKRGEPDESGFFDEQ